MISHAFGIAGRLVLAAVFLLSGVDKLRHPQDFWDAIKTYDVGPAALRRPVVLVLPIVEIALGLLWLSGQFLTTASAATLGLLAVFTGVIAVAMRRGRAVPCGCTGLFRSATVGWNSIARNCGLGAIVLIPVIVSRYSPRAALMKALEQDLGVLLKLDTALLTFTAAMLLLFIVLLLDEVIVLQSKVARTHRLLRAETARSH